MGRYTDMQRVSAKVDSPPRYLDTGSGAKLLRPENQFARDNAPTVGKIRDTFIGAGLMKPAPTLPTEFAKADFKNGVYTLNGVAVTLADLFVATSYSGQVFPLPVLTPGVGWKTVGNGGPDNTNGYEATAALQALMDLTGAGFSIVLDMDIVCPTGGLAQINMPMGDYPDWSYGWDGYMNFHTGPNVVEFALQDFFGADTTQVVGAGFSGKYVNTFSPASLIALINGGAAIQHTPPDPASIWAGTSFFAMTCVANNLDAYVLVRSAKFYRAQNVAGLQALAAPVA